MHRDMIDAGLRRAAAVIEQIGRAGHAPADIADQIAFAGPVAPQRTAITVVPFRPLRGEAADLIAAKTDVPRLGDQLDRRQHRILPDGGQEISAAFEAVRTAAERAGKIEAEAVDMAGLDPVAQRIHHHLQHARMGEVEGIAAAGEVVVVARIVRHQPVIGQIVDAAERQRRAEMVALCGVVVDHVEQHLDAGIVQSRNRGAKGVQRLIGCISRLRREKCDGVVAPVVHQTLLDQIAVIDEAVHWQQFDGGDAEPFEMLDHRRRRQRAIGAAQVRRDVLAHLRQPLDVGFVDDGVGPWDERARFVPSPVEGLIHHHGFRHAPGIVAAVE